MILIHLSHSWITKLFYFFKSLIFVLMSKYYKLILSIEGEEQQENAIAVLNFHSDFESVVQEIDKIIFSFESVKLSKENLSEIISDLKLCLPFSI